MFKEKIVILLSIIFIGTTSLVNSEEKNLNNLILGGSYLEEIKMEEDIKVDNGNELYSLERFFRPSNTPITVMWLRSATSPLSAWLRTAKRPPAAALWYVPHTAPTPIRSICSKTRSKP